MRGLFRKPPASEQLRLLYGGADEAGEQGMRLEWRALQFRIERVTRSASRVTENEVG
jgi:hypothetical protein